jgi:hypothetical protein
MSTSAAKRAQKKHEKALKRKGKPSSRAPWTPGDAQDPVAAWKPLTEGIEGLARRLRAGPHDAAQLAGAIAGQGSRPEARKTWHPERVRELSTEQIVAELATRGVRTDEAAFLALAEARESGRRLAVDAWAPHLRPDATVHDRDFLGEAAVALWERWAPHHVSDESLLDLLQMVAAQSEQRALTGTLDSQCQLWDTVREAGGLPRLARLGDPGAAFADGLVALLGDPAALADPDRAGNVNRPDAKLMNRALATIREVREVLADADLFVVAALAEARVLETLGRSEDAILLLLELAPAHLDEPDLLGEAAEMFNVWPGAPRTLRPRVADALADAADATSGQLRATYARALSELAPARR